MHRAILSVIAFAWVPCCSLAQEPKDLASLRKVKGLPAFIARSVETQGDKIVCKSLEMVEPGKNPTDERLHGRVLLYCDAWDALWLWAAHSNWKMNRAAPFMGLEKPGGKIADLPPPKSTGPVELLRPSRVFLATIDDQGRIVRITKIVVHKLENAD